MPKETTPIGVAEQADERAALSAPPAQVPAAPYEEITAAIHRACVNLAKSYPDDQAGFIRLARDCAIDVILALPPKDAEPAEDALRLALEVIAVGDSSDPVRDAGDELVALGYWRAEGLAQHRAALAASQAASHSAPEPVAWRCGEFLFKIYEEAYECQTHDNSYPIEPLYTTRPAPLGAESKACASVGALSVKCPHCWQKAGEPCIWPETRTHKRDEPHEARKAAALASPAPSVGEPVTVEAVATVKKTRDGLALDWLIEGGIAAMVEGQMLLISGGANLTDDTGSGEVYLTPPAAPAVTEVASEPQRGFTTPELIAALDALYKEAVQCGLGAESTAMKTAYSAILMDYAQRKALAAPAAAVPESPALHPTTQTMIADMNGEIEG